MPILKEYQKIGVEFLKQKRNAILGDEPGLGKTGQAIGFMADNLPAIVVSPSSVKYNWQSECNMWLPNVPVSVVEKSFKPEQITVISYDSLKKYVGKIIDYGFKTIIFDEFTYIKNHKSGRSIAANVVSQNIPNRIFLSGTPILNRSKDIYSILQILSYAYPQLESNYYHFTAYYCNGHYVDIRARGKKIRVWDDSGVSHKEELNKLLSHYMLRRLKSDVLSELPTKTRSIIRIDKTDKDEEQQLILGLANPELPPAQCIDKYRQWAMNKKMAESIKFISDIAENEKVVVGIHHRKPAQDLLLALAKYKPLTISGSDSSEKRQKNVTDFQTKDEHRIIIVSILAGGMGITLTSACKMVILQPVWNSNELLQLEDRISRIGQHYPTDIYYLTLKDSIEETMFRLLINKHCDITAIVDGIKEENQTKLFNL